MLIITEEDRKNWAKKEETEKKTKPYKPETYESMMAEAEAEKIAAQTAKPKATSATPSAARTGYSEALSWEEEQGANQRATTYANRRAESSNITKVDAGTQRYVTAHDDSDVSGWARRSNAFMTRVYTDLDSRANTYQSVDSLSKYHSDANDAIAVLIGQGRRHSAYIDRNRRLYGDETANSAIKEIDGIISGLESTYVNLASENDYWKSFSSEEDYNKYKTFQDYEKLRDETGFDFYSKYRSTKNGEKTSVTKAAILGGYRPDTGFDDIEYDYINGNEEARGIVMANDVASNQYLVGGHKEYLKTMTKEEISLYNYIYATQGKTEANEYLELLGLYSRYRKNIEEAARARASRNGLSESVATILASPLKGLSFLGQAADYLDDGELTKDALYNSYIYQTAAIRDEVSKNFGAVGGFLYNTAMSYADSLMSLALSGGNAALSLPMLFSRSAADATSSALDRGLNSDQAFAFGITSGAIEAITEKIGLDKLLDTSSLQRGAAQHILRNMTAEGLGEGLAGIGNTIADILIAKDKSEWQSAIQAYMKDGLSENEAFRKAFRDTALSVGADTLAGMLMGGTGATLASAGQATATYNAGKDATHNQQGEDAARYLAHEQFNDIADPNERARLIEQEVAKYRETHRSDVAKALIDSFREDGNPLSDSYKYADKLQSKIDAGHRLSNYAIGNLINKTALDNANVAIANEAIGEAVAAQMDGKLTGKLIYKVESNPDAINELAHQGYIDEKINPIKSPAAVRGAIERIANEIKSESEKLTPIPLPIRGMENTAVTGRGVSTTPAAVSAPHPSAAVTAPPRGEVFGAQAAVDNNAPLPYNVSNVTGTGKAQLQQTEGVQALSNTETSDNVFEWDLDAYGMTFEEKSALHNYKAGDSYKINARLRNNMGLNRYYQGMRGGLDTALPKLPVYSGTVYRNLGFDEFGGKEAMDEFVAQHEIGDYICYGAYTSSSKLENGHPIEGDYVVNLVIESITGRNMEGVGQNSEAEVLFERDVYFVPVKITQNEKGQPLIYLKEVAKNVGNQQGSVAGHNRRNQKEQQGLSASTEEGEVRFMPKLYSGDRQHSEMPSVPGGDSMGLPVEQAGVSGLSKEVNTKKASDVTGITADAFSMHEGTDVDMGTSAAYTEGQGVIYDERADTVSNTARGESEGTAIGDHSGENTAGGRWGSTSRSDKLGQEGVDSGRGETVQPIHRKNYQERAGRRNKYSGKTQYRYKAVGRESASDKAIAIADEWTARGFSVVIYEGSIEAVVDGKSIVHSSDSCTLKDGTILLNNNPVLSEVVILAHEPIHVYKKVCPELYNPIYRSMCDSGIDIGAKVLRNIWEAYDQDGSYSDIDNISRLYEEILAQLSGYHAEDPAFAREKFAPLIYEYDKVIAAIENAHREFAKLQQNKRASEQSDAFSIREGGENYDGKDDIRKSSQRDNGTNPGEQISEVEGNSGPNQTWGESGKSGAATQTEGSDFGRGVNAESASNSGVIPYSAQEKKNWQNSNTIVIYENDVQFDAFVNNALKNKDTHKKIYFGKVPKQTAQMVFNKTGVDISGYNIAIKGYEIRKILLYSHGNAKQEALRGQEAITTEDLKNIPSIIAEPDNVILSEKEYEGKPTLLFEKNIDGKNYVVAYASRKHHDIAIQTMYKKRSLATAENANALSSTSKTTSSTASNNIVPQDRNIVKDSIRKNAENDTAIALPIAESGEKNRNASPLPTWGESGESGAATQAEGSDFGRIEVSTQGIAELIQEKNSARSIFVKYAKEKFPETVVNAESNKEIGISRRGIDKFLSGNFSKEKYATGFKIPELIENAHKIGEAENQKEKTGITGYEYYETPVKIDGADYIAYIRVRKTAMGDKYYGHTIGREVSDIKIEPLARSSEENKSTVHPVNALGSNDSIVQTEPAVKNSIRKNAENDTAIALPIAESGEKNRNASPLPTWGESGESGTATQAEGSDFGRGVNSSQKEYSHLYDESKVSREFIESVNPEIENAIISIRAGDLDNVPDVIEVAELNDETIERISDFVGFDISGYSCKIDKDALTHINRRHGIKGEHDSSLSDPKDIARMGYAINHGDDIDWVRDSKGNIKTAKKYKDRNNIKSPVIMIRSRIDGTYCVSQVVSDANKKTIWITSARIQKADGKNQVPNDSKAIPRPQTSETPLSSSSASNNIVPQDRNIVKDSIRKNAENDTAIALPIAERGDKAKKAIPLPMGRKAMSTAELGIEGGVSSDKLHLVDSNSSESAARAQEIADERGLELVLFAGDNLHVKKNGKVVSARGYIIGNRVYVRADDPAFTPEQIMRHEVGHDKIRRGEIDIDRVRERIREKFPGREEQVAKLYEAAYAGSDMSVEEIWKEIICDSLGDMNIFRGDDAESFAGDALHSIAETVEEVRTAPTRAPPANEGKFSISPILHTELQAVLDNTFDKRKNEVLIGTTSDFLVKKLGASPLRVTMPVNKAYAAMVSEQKAKADGRYDERLNYHSLGKTLLSQTLAASENPVAAFVATNQIDEATGKVKDRSDHIVLVTDKQYNGNNIIVIMQVNTSGLYSGKRFKVNKDITVYDRETIASDIIQAENEGRLLHLDKKRSHTISAGVQASNSPAAIRKVDFEDNIARFWNNVKWKKSGKPSNFESQSANAETDMERAYREALERKEGHTSIVLDREAVHRASESAFGRYSRPKLTAAEWRLLNYKMDSEIGTNENFIDEYTKWLYADNGKAKVFAIYGIGDGTVPTPLYAYGGAKASFCMIIHEKITGEIKNGADGIAMPFTKWFSRMWRKREIYISDYDNARNRGDAVANGGISSHGDTQPSGSDNNTASSGENSEANSGHTSIVLDREAVHRASEEFVRKYGAFPKGERAFRDISVPKKTGESSPVSRHVRTVMESAAVPDELVGELMRSVVDGEFSYEPISNKTALSRAKTDIEYLGFEAALEKWRAIASGNAPVDKQGIALGEYILTTAAENNEPELALRVAQELSSLLTQAGQAVQAAQLLKSMTPEGRLYTAQKSLDLVKRQYDEHLKRAKTKLEIPEDIAQEILNAKSKDEIEAAEEHLSDFIAEHIPATFLEKWNNWRYMAMLTNPRTHVKNIFGNSVMYVVRRVKDIEQLPLEVIYTMVDPTAKHTRSTALVTRKADRDFAREEYKIVRELFDTGEKYGASRIEHKRKIFNTKWLEAIRKFNSNLLEGEDNFFMRASFVSAYAQKMKALGYTKEFLNSDSAAAKDARFECREAAFEEALRATFRDASAVANMLKKLTKIKPGEAKSLTAVKALAEGIVPFKQTPVNIAKRGVEYSPIGLVNAMFLSWGRVKRAGNNLTDAADIKLAKQKQIARELDKLASGLLGFGVAILGYFLAQSGFIKFRVEDEDELTGKQSFSLEICGYSITLDWLSPTAMPLFIGAAWSDIIKKQDSTFGQGLKVFTQILEPLSEMSMLSSFEGLLSTVSGSEQKFSDALMNMGLSYIGQGIPTIAGAVARSIDGTRRSTYVPSNAYLPRQIGKALVKTANRIPGASFLSEPYIDAWGREDTDENVWFRLLQNAILPGYVNKINETPVDREIKRLVGATSDEGLYPNTASTNMRVGDKTFHLSKSEYTAWSRTQGQTAYKTLEKLFSHDEYKKLSDEERASIVHTVLEYANAKAQRDFVKGRPEIEREEKKILTSIEGAEKYGIDVTDFLITRERLSDEDTPEQTRDKLLPILSPARQSEVERAGYEVKNTDIKRMSILELEMSAAQKAYIDEVCVGKLKDPIDYTSVGSFYASQLTDNQERRYVTLKKRFPNVSEARYYEIVRTVNKYDKKADKLAKLGEFGYKDSAAERFYDIVWGSKK